MIDEHNFVWYKYCERRDMNISKSNTYSVQTLSKMLCALFMCVCVWWKVSIVVCWLQQHHHHHHPLAIVLYTVWLGGAVVEIYIYIHSFPGHLFQTNCMTPCTFLSPRHVQNTRIAKLSGSFTVHTHDCVSFVLFLSSKHTNRHEFKPHKNRIKPNIHSIPTIEWSDFVWSKVWRWRASDGLISCDCFGAVQ